jgi:hypothetical protein
MSSIIGGIASVILAAYKNSGKRSDSVIYGTNSGDSAAFYQFISILTTLGTSITTGLCTGHILNMMGSEDEHLMTEKFKDKVWWEGTKEHPHTEKDDV